MAAASSRRRGNNRRPRFKLWLIARRTMRSNPRRRRDSALAQALRAVSSDQTSTNGVVVNVAEEPAREQDEREVERGAPQQRIGRVGPLQDDSAQVFEYIGWRKQARQIAHP